MERRDVEGEVVQVGLRDPKGFCPIGKGRIIGEMESNRKIVAIGYRGIPAK